MTSIFLILGGLILLYLGAEGLVHFSAALAQRLRVSPLVIGLTIVAFGTSAPELVVSIKTALAGQGALSVGNVVGSNIFNIAVILGISALIYPLKIEIKLLRFDTPIMILASCLFAILFWDQKISRQEGIILFALIVVYTYYSYSRSKRIDVTEIKEITSNSRLKKYIRSIYAEIVVILISIVTLVVGANLLISGAIAVASILGVSQAVIGLTIVAAGTSLPELATSVVAAIRKNPDIAIGNIVGSNIFNILSILGIASIISPIHAVGIKRLDIFVMLFFSIVLLPFMWTKFQLERWEGFLLLIGYGVYIVLLSIL